MSQLEEGFQEEQKQREEEEAEEERVAMTEAEEYANAGITKEEAEKTAEEQEDLKVAEEIEEAMKGDGNDLDKWNNWVEAANKEAEKTPEEEVKKDLPETKNMIYYGKELEDDPSKKKTYITQVSNKQVPKETPIENTNSQK